jgi:hypothetical protein
MVAFSRAAIIPNAFTATNIKVEETSLICVWLLHLWKQTIDRVRSDTSYDKKRRVEVS